MGYPEHKSPWFTHSIGPVALKAFKTLDAMDHPLKETLLGMPALDATIPAPQVLQSLLQTLEQLIQST